MLDKKSIHGIAQTEILKRIATIQKAFDDLTNSLSSSTKSSAGDKHETSRAMTQLEQEKLSKQLQATVDLRNTLGQIDTEEEHETIQFGSLVETENGTYFISVGLGKIGAEENEVFCISAATLMAKELISKKANDTFEFNDKTFQILSVI